MLDEFGMQTEIKPTLVGQDNIGCIQLTASRHYNARTKHLALRYQHTGDMARLGVVKLKYLKTTDMPADALTKPLMGAAFIKHRQVLLGYQKLDWDELSKPKLEIAGYAALCFGEYLTQFVNIYV